MRRPQRIHLRFRVVKNICDLFHRFKLRRSECPRLWTSSGRSGRPQLWRHSALDERPLAADGVHQPVIGASPAAASSYTVKDAQRDERLEVRNPKVGYSHPDTEENPGTRKIRVRPQLIRQFDTCSDDSERLDIFESHHRVIANRSYLLHDDSFFGLFDQGEILLFDASRRQPAQGLI